MLVLHSMIITLAALQMVYNPNTQYSTEISNRLYCRTRGWISWFCFNNNASSVCFKKKKKKKKMLELLSFLFTQNTALHDLLSLFSVSNLTQKFVVKHRYTFYSTMALSKENSVLKLGKNEFLPHFALPYTPFPPLLCTLVLLTLRQL